MSGPETDVEVSERARVLGSECIHHVGQDQGLNKREYFAAMCMQGMASHEKFFDMPDEITAAFAVRQADALLKELAK